MIVLLLSEAEVQSLIAGRPDEALKHYMARACRHERVLPDANLPNFVLLEHLEGSEDKRSYVAVIRTFASREDAERAWAKAVIP